MYGQRPSQHGAQRGRGKSPAERSEQLMAAQRKLKEEAAERRAAAKAAEPDRRR